MSGRPRGAGGTRFDGARRGRHGGAGGTRFDGARRGRHGGVGGSRLNGARRDERGSGTVLLAAIMSVVVVLGAAATVVAGYLVSHHQARAAADLAALSGASAYATGEQACDQARRTARQNGARLTRCRQVGDAVDFVVTVRVVVEVRVRSPGLPRRVEAEAHAGRVA